MRNFRVPILVLFGVALTLLAVTSGCDGNQTVDKTNGRLNPKPQSSISNMPIPIAGPINYVALGDSTGAGIGARNGGYVARLFKRIIAHRPNSRLINLCVSGATTADVLSEQLNRGIDADPNLVTLGIGINDIGHGFSVERFSKHYEAILSALRSNTQATIIVTNIPDISTAPRIPRALSGEYHQRIVTFNQKLEEIASRHGVAVFDVYTVTHEQLPAHPEYFSGDGFHPSDEGYELWAQEMWPTIAQAIGAAEGR